MERKDYGSISLVPSYLICAAYTILYIVDTCSSKSWLSKFSDFIAFDMYPGIIKLKKDDSNQTVVYLRNGKVLLRGKTLEEVRMALLTVSMLLIIYDSLVFGHFLLIESSYDCDVEDQTKDCFEYTKSDHVNCSDPDVIQGKKLVECYKLVFNIELATGVCYGVYKVCTILLSITITLIMKIKKNHIKRFKIVVGSICLIIFILVIVVIVLAFTIFKTHPFFRVITSLKNCAFFLIGITAAFACSVIMPWKEIVEQKESGNTTVERPPNYIPLLTKLYVEGLRNQATQNDEEDRNSATTENRI